jgi:hypothetical protein
LQGRSASAPALTKGSSWRPPDSVETVAFDCRRAVQILSMNHIASDVGGAAATTLHHLDILKEVSKHSKREAFLALCASSASKRLRHDSLRQLIFGAVDAPVPVLSLLEIMAGEDFWFACVIPSEARSRLASRASCPRRRDFRPGRARRPLRSHTPSARATADRDGSRRPIGCCRIAHRTS